MKYYFVVNEEKWKESLIPEWYNSIVEDNGEVLKNKIFSGETKDYIRKEIPIIFDALCTEITKGLLKTVASEDWVYETILEVVQYELGNIAIRLAGTFNPGLIIRVEK